MVNLEIADKEILEEKSIIKDYEKQPVPENERNG